MAPTCSARQDGGEREEGGPPSTDAGAEGWGLGVRRSHRTSSSGQPPPSAPEEDAGTPEAPALWARPRCTASCSARWARTGSPLIPWFGAHRVPRHGPSLVQSEPQTRPAVYPSVSRSTATRPSACPDPTVSGSPPCGNNQGPRPPRMRTGRHVSPELAVARVPAAGGGTASCWAEGTARWGAAAAGPGRQSWPWARGPVGGVEEPVWPPLAGRGSGAPRSLSRLACATRALGIGGPRGPRLWVREPGLPPPRQMRFSCCAPWPFLKSPQSRCPQGGGPAAHCCWR